MTVANLGLHGKKLEEQIFDIVLPIAKALNLELLEVICQGRGPGILVRVTIDKIGGVGIQECEQCHQSLSHALDVADPIPHSYRLEVSSPGLDRPLKGPDDYRRFVEKLIRVKLREPLGGQWVYIGRLLMVQDEGIVISVPKGKKHEEWTICWELIAGGRLEIEF